MIGIYNENNLPCGLYKYKCSNFPLNTEMLYQFSQIEDFIIITLKGLCPIRVMSNFDFFNPGR